MSLTGVRSATRPALSATAWTAVLVVIVGSVSYLIVQEVALGVVAAVAVVVIGVTAYDPTIVPVVAMPTLIIAERVGGEPLDMTLSDVVLFAMFWLVLVFTPRPFTPALRSMLWLSAFYQLTILFTVIATPFPQNAAEWFHAWLLVGGALVVGWGVGRSGRATLGLTLLSLLAGVIALNACLLGALQLVGGDTGAVYPTWPFALHKNLAGPIFMSVALLAFLRQPWLRWPTWYRIPLFYLLVLGMLAVQSRQAIVGLGIGLMVLAFRPGHGRRIGPRLILLTTAPAAVFVAGRVQEDLSGADRFSSTAFRAVGIEGGMDVWRDNPWFGAGMRWWTVGPTPGFQPPNAFAEVLSSVGVVGLLGFATLLVGTLVVAWRMNPRYGTLAVALLASRLVASQFDQFWVSILVSLPFLLVGVCLGAEGYEKRPRHRATELVRARRAGPRSSARAELV
ncbi:O-antigen ligase family protein [Isoptericola croceus]|uniref:O-antigen ligase family protein n=1 Tax=Isoptericola croceus TaxID=3031406 RepID=UPI0023F86833|nr:O-antigen ligase family protein [Isoptericola croceus]